VCSTGDYRPFTFRDADGNWAGLDIDMAHSLAEHLGANLELVPTTWPNLMNDIGSRCDVAMGGITLTAARAERALFSQPYLHDGKSAIIRCTDSARFHTLSDIDQPGVRVVENPGGTNEEFARGHVKNAQLQIYPDNNTIFEQLTSGAADVMFTDTSEIRYQTKQNPALCGVGVDQPFTSDEKAYLLPQGDTALRDAVNEWLNTVQHDGTYAALSNNYLGAVVGP
jgi:cyclohexadienyl dehydratase